jgi:hypothetical protein
MRLSERLFSPSSLPAPAMSSLTSLASSAGRVLARWPDVFPEPAMRDRERLVQEVSRRWAEDRWDGARMSLVTSAARALFDLDRRDRSDLVGLREFYVSEIRASTRPTFLDAMLAVYIDSFVPGAEHTRALAGALSGARERMGTRAQRLLNAFPECLDALRAPDALASSMIAMRDCWSELKVMGIRSPHAPGLMEYAHLEFVRLIRPELKARAAVEKLFHWLKPESQQPLSAGAAEAITATLEHWVERDPPQDELTNLTQSLIALYGDPRVKRGGVWASVPDNILAVLFRWLTGENIRFFLDVVSAVEESHMWAPRKAFWLGLHEQKRIKDAWVAFSDDAIVYARRQLGTHGDRALLSFGRQVARGTRSSTSLLILRIGNKIVVEGSHNYRVHIFREDSPDSPRLYLPAYDCERIRLSNGAEAKSHLGNWQHWVLLRI